MVCGNGKDFVGKLLLVPEIVGEGGPDNFGNTGLLGENETVTVVGGFKSGEAKWLRDGTHDENIRNGINVAKFLAADETSENDIFGDAEICGEFNEFVSFFAVAGQDENELGVLGNGECGGFHEIM